MLAVANTPWPGASHRTPGGQSIICAPGNPGMRDVGVRFSPLPGDDPDAAAGLASQLGADLTIVGPEAAPEPRRGRSVRVRRAADPRPDAGRGRARDQQDVREGVHGRHGVPTAAYHVCDSAEDAVAFLTSGRFGFPVVLKADGLAAGKGVVVAPDAATAHAAVTAMMRERRFGTRATGWSSRSASRVPSCRTSC